jgi:hypothetical protein
MTVQWSDIRGQSASYFSELVRELTADGILGLSADSQALYSGPIDWGWGSDAVFDTKLDAVKSQYLMRCNQVEILLRESVSLIERCLDDSNKFDGLNTERFKTMIEFVEYNKIYNQQQVENSDEEYSNGTIAEADFSRQSRIAASGDVGRTLDELNEAGTHYSQEYNAINDGAARAAAAAQISMGAVAILQYNATVASNGLESNSRNARLQFEKRSKKYKIDRQQIANDIISIKLNELRRPHGALNYNERLSAIARRAEGDFLEVYARLSAVCVGIREFYAITDPSVEDLRNEMRNSRSRIEGTLNWLRRATNAIGRAKMDEQECTLRLTTAFPGQGELLKRLNDGLTLQFLPERVSHMNRVKLRGISATGEPGLGDAWIDIVVTSPESKLDSVEITLPSVMTRLGRVSSSGSLNIRDVAGGRPIINRSPIGDWTMRALAHDRGDQFERLHLDLHLTFS